MMRCATDAMWAVAALLLVCAGAGCKTTGQQRSTRLTVEDFQVMAAEMAASLRASDAFAGRTPDSPVWMISINKVENLTSDLIPERERWAMIAKLRGQLPLRTLADQMNIRFVIPPERVAALRNNPNLRAFDDGFGSERTITHEMSATFRSITRANELNRTELYVCEFQMLDVRTAEPAWTDRFEFKRSAFGHVWD